MGMTFRTLPPMEWNRLIEDDIEPFATTGLPDPSHALIVVAEEDGHIHGASLLLETVVNHWCISSHARRSPTMVSGLWRATKAELDAHEVSVLHATVSDEHLEVQDMVERLGYHPADGKLYVLDVANCLLNGRN